VRVAEEGGAQVRIQEVGSGVRRRSRAAAPACILLHYGKTGKDAFIAN